MERSIRIPHCEGGGKLVLLLGFLLTASLISDNVSAEGMSLFIGTLHNLRAADLKTHVIKLFFFWFILKCLVKFVLYTIIRLRGSQFVGVVDITLIMLLHYGSVLNYWHEYIDISAIKCVSLWTIILFPVSCESGLSEQKLVFSFRLLCFVHVQAIHTKIPSLASAH